MSEVIQLGASPGQLYQIRGTERTAIEAPEATAAPDPKNPNAPAKVAKLQQAKPAKRAKAAEKLTKRDFRKELKARRREVEREVKRLRGLQDELAEIDRLIAALGTTTARKSG